MKDDRLPMPCEKCGEKFKTLCIKREKSGQILYLCEKCAKEVK